MLAKGITLIISLLLHSFLSMFDGLSQLLERFFGFLAILYQRQILFLEFGKDVKKLLRIRKKQFWFLFYKDRKKKVTYGKDFAKIFR